MRVIVAGGGIGGVAASLALQRDGVDVLLLEQAPALGEVGAGLSLAPNAMKVLDYLNVSEDIRQVAVKTEESVLFDMASGERLFTSTDALAANDVRYTAHRADLHSAMVRRLKGGSVRLNSRVVSFVETADKVCVLLEDGEELEADALVGADGLKSTVRTELFGYQEPHFTGLVGWRALIPTADAPNIEPIQRTCLWMGSGRHVGFYPIRKDLLNLFAWVPADEVHRESWMLSGDVADLHRALSGACPQLQALLDCVKSAMLTPLYVRPPRSTWSSSRVTLLGDAAHPAPTAAGQGAAMALEDGVTIAHCLARHGASGVADAMKDYELRRVPRATQMQALALGNLKFMNEPDPVQRAARNGYLSGLERLDPLGKVSFDIMSRYDAVAALAQPSEVVAAAGGRLTPRVSRPEAKRAFDLWAGAVGFSDRVGLWVGQRAAFGRFCERAFTLPSGARTESLTCNGVPALRIGDGAGPILMHLHGGAYTMGSAQGSAELAGRLATAVGGVVIVPDYRLAPEHPYPAAPNDAMQSYLWLLEQEGGDARRIIVTGECAGGGLALSLMLSLRQAGLPLPAAVYLCSPFCDLTLSGKSISLSQGRDPWLNRAFLTQFAASYVQKADPEQPLMSPIRSDLSGLPPLLIHVAEDEALRDDAVQLAEAARAAGVETTLRVVSDTVHSFILFNFLPETAEAMDEVSQFVGRQLSRDPQDRAPAPA